MRVGSVSARVTTPPTSVTWRKDGLMLIDGWWCAEPRGSVLFGFPMAWRARSAVRVASLLAGSRSAIHEMTRIGPATTEWSETWSNRIFAPLSCLWPPYNYLSSLMAGLPVGLYNRVRKSGMFGRVVRLIWATWVERWNVLGGESRFDPCSDPHLRIFEHAPTLGS